MRAKRITKCLCSARNAHLTYLSVALTTTPSSLSVRLAESHSGFATKWQLFGPVYILVMSPFSIGDMSCHRLVLTFYHAASLWCPPVNFGYYNWKSQLLFGTSQSQSAISDVWDQINWLYLLVFIWSQTSIMVLWESQTSIIKIGTSSWHALPEWSTSGTTPMSSRHQ